MGHLLLRYCCPLYYRYSGVSGNYIAVHYDTGTYGLDTKKYGWIHTPSPPPFYIMIVQSISAISCGAVQ
jgi:hypothetical protein